MGKEVLFAAILLVFLLSQGAPYQEPPHHNADAHYDSNYFKGVYDEPSEGALPGSPDPFSYVPMICVILVAATLAYFLLIRRRAAPEN